MNITYITNNQTRHQKTAHTLIHGYITLKISIATHIIKLKRCYYIR